MSVIPGLFQVQFLPPLHLIGRQHQGTLLCCAGGTKSSSQVSYQRHVPKFLQAHMHLLGKPAGEAGASHTGKEHGQLRPDNDSDVEDNEDEVSTCSM